MSEPTPPRPSQVTTGALLVVLGSVLLVVFAFQRVSSIGSAEFQDAVRDTLSKPPGDGLGISVDDVQALVRVLSYVAAAAAVTCAILAREVLQRSVRARTALSVIAPVLFVAGFAVSALIAAFVAAGVVMLWTEPARAWFLGRTTPTAPVLPPSVQPRQPLPPMPTGRPAEPAEPAQTPRLPYPHPQVLPPPATGPVWTPSTPSPSARPPGVVAACIITWVMCAIVAGVGLLCLFAVAVARDEALRQLHDNGALRDAGISDHSFLVALSVVATVLVVWSLAASVLAIGAIRRATWGWVGLVVSAVVAAMLSLASLAVGGFVAIVPLIACAVAASLLLRPEARAWFAQRRP